MKNHRMEIIMKGKVFSFCAVFGLLISSIAAFGMYMERYLNYNVEYSQQIRNLMKEAGVLENRYIMFLGILIAICTFLLWSVAFVVYKITFWCAKVWVEDLQLLIGIGAGLVFSFIISYALIGHIHTVLVILIANISEIIVVFLSLYDKLREKIRICVPIRCIFLVANILIAIFLM